MYIFAQAINIFYANSELIKIIMEAAPYWNSHL